MRETEKYLFIGVVGLGSPTYGAGKQCNAQTETE